VVGDALGAGMGEDRRGLGRRQGVLHGFLRDVAEIHQQAHAVHLLHYRRANGARPLWVGLAVALSPQRVLMAWVRVI
jgi:hypothetical protein